MELDTYFLYPSTLFVSNRPHLVTTILGSCVAVCLWDSLTQMGGVNHYMLPFWNGQGLASPKYGNIAIEKLIEKVESIGCQHRNLKAKVFGGAEIFNTSMNSFKIGQRNVVLARQMLDEAKIPVVSSSTGGNLGRKIIFNTQTGEVIHKFIQPQEKFQ
jgi:chemotaxis protein CheD